MIIKDNVFSEKQITALQKQIDKDIAKYGGGYEECEIREESDHHGTTESSMWHLENKARMMFLQYLVDAKLFSPNAMKQLQLGLRYHVMRHPYTSSWHKDRLADWDSDNIDYIGVSYYFNQDWNYLQGGLYIYKDNTDSTRGHYVEPIGNRLIINDDDLWHGVTTINDPSVVRSSLQMFIAKKYLLQ